MELFNEAMIADKPDSTLKSSMAQFLPTQVAEVDASLEYCLQEA